MRVSKSFFPTLKEVPAEAEVVSHQLMLRAGLVSMMAKGLYAWLPLGQRVLKNLQNIINKNMYKIGFQEVIAPILQPANLWKRSGRYEGYGPEMLRVRDRHDAEFVYGPTAEECFVEMFEKANMKYSQLPTKLYNIQWKFRDEIRPRFGVLRSREFLMKDGYSFSLSAEEVLETYQQVFSAYINIFDEMGLHVLPAVADTGVMGGSLSHDFHVLAETGENTLYYDKKWEGINKPSWSDINSLYSKSDENHDLAVTGMQTSSSIEVGHIFMLGQKYTSSMGIKIQTAQGLVEPHMGCYGIGVSRLVAAIIESSHDQNGIVWPASIAPYKIIILNLDTKHAECNRLAEEIHTELGDDVIYDDTDKRPGEKFAFADLIGCPLQIIIGNKDLDNGQITFKIRKTGEKRQVPVGSWRQALAELKLL